MCGGGCGEGGRTMPQKKCGVTSGVYLVRQNVDSKEVCVCWCNRTRLHVDEVYERSLRDCLPVMSYEKLTRENGHLHLHIFCFSEHNFVHTKYSL